jgi:hypothetical protein
VLTDEFGFFRIKLDKKEEQALSITVSKKDFKDTTLLIDSAGNQYFHISLVPIARPVAKPDTVMFVSPAPPDTAQQVIDEVPFGPRTEEVVKEDLDLPYESSPNVQNISDTLYRDFQVSILPFIGTNGRMSGNVVNNYSVNLFGGFSMGTRQVELGGFFNIDRGDAGFLQVAGWGNVVGGSAHGFQLGGLFNMTGGGVTGMQLAGLTNVNMDDADGVQVAGLANINIAAANGLQVAGLYNHANGNSDGIRIAGLANVHVQDFDGPQIAGLTNINHGRVRGSQIAGIYNYGHKVYGTQIGFVNFADSLTGVPIGFLSFVNHGYHKVELSADEMFYANLAFRTGVNKFYNIILVGMKPEFPVHPDGGWTFGYGIGTAPRLAKWLYLNIDATGQHVNIGEWTQTLSTLTRLHLGFDFQIARKFSMYAGGTLNGYFSQSEPPILGGTLFLPGGNAVISAFSPPVFHDEDINNNVNLKMWLGWKVALRFL